MNLIENYMKLHFNNYLKHKKIYNLKIKNKDNLNTKINIDKSPNLSFSNNSNNEENSKNYSENSNENSEDINHISSTNLKDKILSPGDDDICLPKKTSPPKDNFQGDDDICFYNIRNINMQPNNNKKKLLILDLDETLVHSSFLPLGKDKNNKVIEPDIFLKILFDKKYYDLYVLTRPYIYEFLNDMSKIFIIYIFTASVKEYANPLLNEIDTDNIISKRLFRDSCTLSNDGKFIKNLNNLNYNLKDVILVDNNPISYRFNKANGIPIKSWHNDKNDKELLKMRNFLNFLSYVDDVRYYIPKVVENDAISFYKVNTMIAQQININNIINNINKEDNINRKINKRTNSKNSFNNSVNNITPHKKINFNKDENNYANVYTRTEANNNTEPINYREPQPKTNYFQKYRNSITKNNVSPCLGNNRVNRYNIKININSINFNLVNRKSHKNQTDSKYTRTDNNEKAKNYFSRLNNLNNKEKEDLNYYKHKISKKLNVNKNINKFRLSVNDLIYENKLNKTDDNKESNNIHFNTNKNNNSTNFNCNSYNKDKKINSIYSYNIKKKKTNEEKVKKILEKKNNYNLNLNLYEGKDNSYNSNLNKKKDKINKIKVKKINNLLNNNYYYNKTNDNNLKIKSNNNKDSSMDFKIIAEKYRNKRMNRNENIKGYKTFCDNKEDDIIINDVNNVNSKDRKVVGNGNQKYSISYLFKQEFLASSKEPIKLKLLKKEISETNKNESNKVHMKRAKITNRINSQPFINKNNYYHKRKIGFIKTRRNTELLNNIDLYNNNIIDDSIDNNDNIYFIDHINFDMQKDHNNNKERNKRI